MPSLITNWEVISISVSGDSGVCSSFSEADEGRWHELKTSLRNTVIPPTHIPRLKEIKQN